MAKKAADNMASSDFNMKTLNTKEYGDHVRASIDIGGNFAVFGRRGTGKTIIAKDAIRAAGLTECYLNLSVLERTDVGGYPDVMASARNSKFVDFLLPQFFASMMEGKKGVVALLDEVDKCDSSLYASMLEFTQFRTINGKPLPNLKAVIMTGNLISEGGARPSLPLLDRAEKYLVESSPEQWLNWAGRSGAIHPSVTSYIQDHPKDLFGAVDPEDRYADPSPRGWDRASHIIKCGEERGWSNDMLNTKVAGCVGKDAALKYYNYYEHYQQLLPMIDDVFDGKSVKTKFDSLEPTKKLIATMITCSRLSTVLDGTDAAKSEKAIKNVGKFMKHVTYELVLITVRSQIQVDRIVKHNLDEHPEWADTLNKINLAINGS